MHRELRALLAIALPLAAAYLAEVAMMLTDMVIVGRLGSVELAAVGLAGDLVFELLFICMGIASIVGVLVAQASGSGQPQFAGHAVRQGLWVATALSIAGTALCWNLASLLALTGQDPRVIALAEDYVHAVAWCFLPSMWFVVLRNFVTALSRARSVMVITIAAIALNLMLNYTLVFGKFGFPALGVAGAGWGTTIVCWVMFAALTRHIVRAADLKIYRIFGGLRAVDLSLCLEILRLGLPVAGITMVEGGMFAVVAILMGVLGANSLAANQIVFGWATTAIVVAIAVGEATMVRVAYGIGAGNPRAARRAGYLGIALGALFMAAMAALALSIPEYIAALFLDIDDPANADVLALAVTLFSIAALFQIFDGTQAIASRALRGLKDTFVPMWIGAVGYWVFGVTGGYVLAFPLGLDGPGLWWGLALGLSVAGVVLTWRFHVRIGALIRDASSYSAV